MSRYCGEKVVQPILDAAAHWKVVALQNEGSVFTDRNLWTEHGLGELEKHFVQNLDEGDGTFLQKLEQQLSSSGPAVKQLAAEMIWFMYLCPSNVTATHKRSVVGTIWAWSGEKLPVSNRYLSDEVLSGIGSGGPGYAQYQWRELAYFIRSLLVFRRLPEQERQILASNPSKLAAWLTNQPDGRARQLRHMLLFLLFPDDFERIFGQTDRQGVLAAFSKVSKGDAKKLDPVEIDRRLRDIRTQLEKEYGTKELDYYVSPIKERWKTEVIAQDAESDVSAIQTLLAKFLAQAQAAEDLTTKAYLKSYRALTVKVSFGQGVFARIPWIAILAGEQQVSNGIYPVLLYFRQEKVLLLCYGVSETSRPALSWVGIGETQTVKGYLMSQFGREPDRYGDSFVHKAYELDRLPSLSDIAKDLDAMIDTYIEIIGAGHSTYEEKVVAANQLDMQIDLRKTGLAFSSALRNSFVTFGESHDEIVMSFIASLATKPFAILTGLSGSGKTQIAVRLGEWLGKDRLFVAAVRPDWTGAEALFGFEDGLKPAIAGMAAWSVPETLAFILSAASDPKHIYLLLLDEMNLAHVERYFGDILSGMESGQPCLPNLSKGDDGVWRQSVEAARRIPVPGNLWVVGTVNVDETTYMFSPKVLDRANTFEFRVASRDLSAEIKKPEQCEPGDQALIRGLLTVAKNSQWHQDNPAGCVGTITDKLRQLHEVLSRYGLEFGHRAFYEAVRFAAIAEEVGLGNMEKILDRIVLQKVLPRLHGSRRRLEQPLIAIVEFTRDLPEVAATNEKPLAISPEARTNTTPKLPASYDKACRMLVNLRANQFASFTE